MSESEPAFDPFRPADTDLHDEANPPFAEVVSAAPSAGTPRLGISHILLWMTSTAVLISINQWIMRQQVLTGRMQITASERIFYFATEGILAGPALGCVFLAIARQLRGIRFPRQPGEWLLLTWGMLLPLMLVSRYVWAVEPDSYKLVMFTQTLLGLICGVAYVLIAAFPAMPARWRFSFLAVSAAWFGQAAMQGAFLLNDFVGFGLFDWMLVFRSTSLLLLLGKLGLLLFAAVKDRMVRASYGWLHWTGVFAGGASTLLQLGMMIYYWYR